MVEYKIFTARVSKHVSGEKHDINANNNTFACTCTTQVTRLRYHEINSTKECDTVKTFIVLLTMLLLAASVYAGVCVQQEIPCPPNICVAGTCTEVPITTSLSAIVAISTGESTTAVSTGVDGVLSAEDKCKKDIREILNPVAFAARMQSGGTLNVPTAGLALAGLNVGSTYGLNVYNTEGSFTLEPRINSDGTTNSAWATAHLGTARPSSVTGGVSIPDPNTMAAQIEELCPEPPLSSVIGIVLAGMIITQPRPQTSIVSISSTTARDTFIGVGSATALLLRPPMNVVVVSASSTTLPTARSPIAIAPEVITTQQSLGAQVAVAHLVTTANPLSAITSGIGQFIGGAFSGEYTTQTPTNAGASLGVAVTSGYRRDGLLSTAASSPSFYQAATYQGIASTHSQIGLDTVPSVPANIPPHLQQYAAQCPSCVNAAGIVAGGSMGVLA